MRIFIILLAVSNT